MPPIGHALTKIRLEEIEMLDRASVSSDRVAP
jgi:hypothetical protein